MQAKSIRPERVFLNRFKSLSLTTDTQILYHVSLFA
jgi:hypothetical protein